MTTMATNTGLVQKGIPKCPPETDIVHSPTTTQTFIMVERGQAQNSSPDLNGQSQTPLSNTPQWEKYSLIFYSEKYSSPTLNATKKKGKPSMQDPLLKCGYLTINIP